jgi:hypothetical protein
MNNIQKAFKAKAELGLRKAPAHYADGGVVTNPEPSVGGFMSYLAHGMRLPSERVAAPSVVQSNLSRYGNGRTLDSQIEAQTNPPTPAPVEEAPAPEQPRIRFADGGSVIPQPSVGGFISYLAHGMRLPSERGIAPVASAPSNITKYGNGHDIDSQIEAQTSSPAPVAPSEPEPQRPAIRFMDGGGVRGCSGIDKVPAMLTKDEYVLPVDTVKAVGKENLDALKDATHTPVNPMQGLRKVHMADGGYVGQAWNKIKGMVGSSPITAGDTPLPEINPTMATAQTAKPTPAFSSSTNTLPPEPAPGYARDAAGNLFKGTAPTAPSTGLRAAAGRVAGAAGRGAAGLGAAYEGYQAVNSASNGDAVGAVDHGVNAIASGALMTPAAPVAGAYLGGKVIGNTISNNLSDEAQDVVGGTINQGLRSLGEKFGQDWGNDDSHYLMMKARTPGAVVPRSRTAKATAVNDEDAAFNKTLAERGAGDVAMTTTNGVRTLGNVNGPNPFDNGVRSPDRLTAPQAAQAKAGRDMAEQALQHRYAEEAGLRTAAQQQGNGLDMSGINDEIRAAQASGRPGLARQLIDARTALVTNATTNAMTARGQDVTAADNRRTVGAQMYGHDLSARNALMMRQMEQFNKDREFGDSHTKAQAEMRNASDSQLQKNIEAANATTDSNGKPTFDANAVAQQRQFVDKGVAALGANGAHELSPLDTQRLIAGGHLLSKIQGDATNWPIPWKPDYLKTSNAADLIGMVRLKNGDAQLRNGNIIPARYIEKQDADYFGGKPTTDYNILFSNKGK